MILVWLKRIEEYTCYVLFLSGILVSLYGVFTRYVLNMPQSWITEIFEYLMVWAIFIAFGMALKNNRHIVVDLVYDKLPFAYKRVISTISNLIGAGYSFFLMITGIEMVKVTYIQQNVTLDVGMPLWIPYLIMPVGMGLLGIYFLLKSYKSLKGDQQEIIGYLEHEEYIKEVKEKTGGIA
jgi:C4-dicarboxylate transporter, DctQ subunit